MINGRKRFRGEIAAVDDEGVTIRLPDAPGGTDPDHKLAFPTIAEAKLVMTDKLMDMARADQELPHRRRRDRNGRIRRRRQ